MSTVKPADVPILDVDRFRHWKRQMITYMTAHGLMGVLDLKLNHYSSQSNHCCRTCQEKAWYALEISLGSCSIIMKCFGSSYPDELWEYICEEYDTNDNIISFECHT